MNIKEAFEKLAKSTANSMKNPFFVIASLDKDFHTIAEDIKEEIPTADEIPFDNTGTSLSSNDVEGAIKELNKTANLLFDYNNQSGTYKEFDLYDNLSKYQFLIFLYMQYSNTRVTVVEPRVVFDSQTSSGARVQIWYNGNMDAEIYKVSDTKVAIKMTDTSGTHRIRIQGFN